MHRILKRLGFGLLALFLVAAAAFAAAVALGTRKMERRVEVTLAPVADRHDAAAVERGRYLYVSRNCAVCHGADGRGGDVVDEPGGMRIHAPNLTPAAGSVVGGYMSADWQRTIRHGVKPDGRPAILMPSEDYARLSDDDLGALVAFVRQLPAAAGPGATIHLPPLVKALYAVGLVKDSAERIDHALPPQPPVAEGVTPAYGAYVAATCVGCHGEHFSGGKIPGAPPDWPAAANLTPGAGSAMARYPDTAALAAMFRSGKRPDGSAVHPAMPFGGLKAMSDLDVGALHLYLAGLPPRPAGER